MADHDLAEAAAPAPYAESMIHVLGDREHVRTRPGMYVGGLNERGLHQLLWELVDNSLDEAAAGFATTVTVTVHADGSCTVADDGRGIPIRHHAPTGVPIVEVVFTTFNLDADCYGDVPSVYGPGAAMSGVGAAVVNFLSERLDVEVRRDGRVSHLRCEGGFLTQPTTAIGRSDRTGTRVTFRPDRALFGTLAFDRRLIADRLRELAALHAGVRIGFEDDRVGSRDAYWCPAGTADHVRHLSADDAPLTDVIAFRRADPARQLWIDGAVQHVNRPGRTVLSYANDWPTTCGTHVAGLHAGIGEAYGRWAERAGVMVDARARRLGGLWRGLVAVVAVRMPEPSYARCTKDELNNPAVRPFVAAAVADALNHHLRRHPDQARAVLAATGLSPARVPLRGDR